MVTKIVIASALKPVIDPRMYEKMGQSLAKEGRYEVHIIGALPATGKVPGNIHLHPLEEAGRSLRTRIILPWLAYRIIRQIEPELLIINTHELLFIGALYKLLSGKKLIYDIRENYYFNLIYQDNYPWGIKHLLGAFIRLNENIFGRMADHFFLAEQCYADELSFIGQRYTVIENKYQPLPEFDRIKGPERKQFILSGTISTEYGIWETLDFFRHFQEDDYTLVIIGHCPNRQTYQQLKAKVAGQKNIDLQVSLTPVPHASILKKIGPKTIGLLPYTPNKSTQNKVPTKLYEYIGIGIPVLISPNPLWNSMIKKYNAGLSIDFNNPPVKSIKSISFDLNKEYYSPDLLHIMWNNEESKLLAVIKTVI